MLQWLRQASLLQLQEELVHLQRRKQEILLGLKDAGGGSSDVESVVHVQNFQVKRKLGSQSSASGESFMSQLDQELQSKLRNIGMHFQTFKDPLFGVYQFHSLRSHRQFNLEKSISSLSGMYTQLDPFKAKIVSPITCHHNNNQSSCSRKPSRIKSFYGHFP